MEYNDNDISSDLTEKFGYYTNNSTITRTYKNERNNKIRNNTNNKKKHKHNKNNNKFKKKFKLYILLLTAVCFIFLVYVLNTLYQYEASFTENYIESVVHDITKTAKRGKISKICDINSIEKNALDNSNKSYESAIKQIFKTSNISYKLNDATRNSLNPTYSIYADNNKIMEVTLKVKEQKNRLKLFTYPIWEVENYKLNSSRGLKFYDIFVPSNYVVEVNGTKLTESYVSTSTLNEDYEKFSEYVKLPKMVNYELNNFIEMPNIKITDNNGKEVETIVRNNKIEIESSCVKVNNYEEAKNYLSGELDILKLAENWSLFLTDDLNGNLHGFYNLKPYLIQNSSFYKMAYAWATSVDITFVSSHTLKSPTFTNEKLENFTIYSENAFSCDVYLEKNMKIANGNDKVDIMHDKLYFVYYDDTNDNENNPTWKLIDMKSIIE